MLGSKNPIVVRPIPPLLCSLDLEELAWAPYHSGPGRGERGGAGNRWQEGRGGRWGGGGEGWWGGGWERDGVWRGWRLLKIAFRK